MDKESVIHIGYAEDNMIVRKGIIELIKGLNKRFNVFIEADNGKELLEKIAKAAYQPDICIIDINMPVMNGYETVLKIKEKYPYIRCLAVTIFEDEYPILKMLKNGVSGYIFKNSNPRELAVALLELYNNNLYLCEEIRRLFPEMSKNKFDCSVKLLFTGQ